MHQKIDWQSFWNSYRTIEAQQEADLFFQVGKTVNKLPISYDIFTKMVENIVQSLKLTKKDILLELCCGNGLLTYPLSNFSRFVYAFDFAKQMIDNAKRFKNNENINYTVGDAKANFFELFEFVEMPNKFLINDSLAYFTADDLQTILATILENSKNFSFYITGIPCEELKWNFYNTEERKKTYLSDVENGDSYNNGMGKWWSIEELKQLALAHGLECIIEMPSKFYNYRVNALLEKQR